jgi:histidine ammonia-lyase
LLAPLKTGSQAAKAQAIVRAESKMMEADRSLAPDIRAVEQGIAAGAFSDILH